MAGDHKWRRQAGGGYVCQECGEVYKHRTTSCPLEPPSQPELKATGHDYHNGCHANKKAVERALDALRKIALNHPCDLHDRIAAIAVQDVATILAGGTPPPAGQVRY